MISDQTPNALVKRQTTRLPLALHKRIRTYCRRNRKQYLCETGRVLSTNEFLINASQEKLSREAVSGD